MPKKKMDLEELRGMLASEFEAAMGAMQSSKLVTERADALDYYFGHMDKDMPAADGRSKAVSFDVADTVEGLMPSLMEIFAGSDEVVQFDPVGPEDVEAAKQETDYVNHVFMNENPGFSILYSFLKDGLLSKVGIVKVFWDEKEKYERETYYDQSDDVYALIVSSPDVDVVEHTEKQDPSGQTLHDITVRKKRDYSNASAVPVPPEEFVIERGARTLKDTNYCCHRVIKPEQRLIEMGFDEEQVRALPVYRAYTNVEELARDTVDEHQFYDSDVNPAVRLKQVLEHYVRMDYEGDGESRLYRVTTSGTTGEILERDGKPDVEEFDEIPFATWTPFPVPHRFWGRSIADMTMDIQRVKTAITRGCLDNIYLALNPRVEVPESHASDNTLDDILVSRPGGVIRTKQPGGISWQEVPNVTGNVFPALEYYDTLREWRTGVSRVSQGVDAEALQNQSATATAQMYTAAQQKMKLIARVAAETGVRDLFYLFHGVIRKHGQKARTVRLRNQWITVDPRNFKTRNDMTINVGTGTGGRAQRLSELMLIAGAQEKLLTAGLSNIVTPENLFGTAKELTRAAGHKDVGVFFTDPQGQPAPQQPPDPKLQEAQMKMQMQQASDQAQQQLEVLRIKSQSALEQQKFEHQRQLDMLEMGMKQKEHEHNLAVTLHKARIDQASAAQKMEIEKQKAATQAAKPAKQGASVTVAGSDKTTDALGKLTEHLSKSHEHLAKVTKHLSAPKKIIRDPKTNRVVGVESVEH